MVELSYHGEKAAEEGDLARLLRDHGSLESDHPIFVPYLSYTYKGVRSLLSVMEGYAFLASGFDDSSRAGLLRSPYIKKFLTRGSSLYAPYETVPQASVDALRQNLSDLMAVEIGEGMQVVVIDGPLTGIKGEVVGVSGERATLLVEMRSIHALRHLPCFLLRPLDNDE